MGRYFLVLIAGSAILIGGMRLTLNRVTSRAADVSFSRYNSMVARNNAHSAVQLCFYQLNQDANWRDGYTNLSVNGGTASATVTNVVADTVQITAQGTYGGTAVTVQTLARLGSSGWPAAINAGVTARCQIKTLGNMIIDGRDHDLNGSLIANNGTYALRTTSTFSRGGNSKIGGTTIGQADVAPAKTGYSGVIQTSYIWPDGYPSTPDLVMGGSAAGYPEGTLKAIAMSGANGSQYVTNPSALTYPLSGVTYVELPNGGTWNPVSFGTVSTGILIVHNTNYNATIKNLNSGTFKGLIIADDLVHVHTTIIGAIFGLTTGPSEGNCIGNGNGSLLFSRNAVLSAAQATGVGSSGVNAFQYYE